MNLVPSVPNFAPELVAVPMGDHTDLLTAIHPNTASRQAHCTGVES